MNRYPGFAPVSNLIGTPIVDSDGAIIGEVREFLIDETDGRIAYIQFELDREGSRAGQRITIPWSSIRSAAKSRAGWRLSVGKATLQALSSSHPA
jgi:sporulation protein YlmC with PRC-barrel domain